MRNTWPGDKCMSKSDFVGARRARMYPPGVNAVRGAHEKKKNAKLKRRWAKFLHQSPRPHVHEAFFLVSSGYVRDSRGRKSTVQTRKHSLVLVTWTRHSGRGHAAFERYIELHSLTRIPTNNGGKETSVGMIHRKPPRGQESCKRC